jgi:hypothetical protein
MITDALAARDLAAAVAAARQLSSQQLVAAASRLSVNLVQADYSEAATRLKESAKGLPLAS